MLRGVLTYQLILAVAVGPMLCCCSAGKSLAAVASAQRRVPAEPASSCCAHKSAPAKHTPAEKPNPAKHGEPTEKCPCKDGSGKPPAVQADPTPAALAALKLLALDDIAVTFALPNVTCAPAGFGPHTSGGAGAAHLTTSALLYAHHKLRC
jgi:hypothetical protein